MESNPFKPPEEDVPREKKAEGPKRDPFKPEEARKVLEAVPQGDRMGDLFRVGLVTGARITEIAKVRVSDAKEDGSVFLIAGARPTMRSGWSPCRRSLSLSLRAFVPKL